MKVLIFAGYGPFLVNFRGDLIKSMVSQGHNVVAVAPEPVSDIELQNIGVRFCQIQFDRTGVNPLQDIGLLFSFIKLLKKEKPDLVFSYNIKPAIYGSIASRLSGVKNVFFLVCGLGSVFIATGMKANVMRFISKILYRISAICSNKVFFQNPDDLNMFVNDGIVKRKKCVLVNGSGINLNRFKPTKIKNEPIFLMISRIIQDKGVMEYIQAARIVKNKYSNASFLLVGPYDKNPSGLKPNDLLPYINDGSIEYFGAAMDVRPFLEQTSIYVLPSYSEGTPRSVLEAMAMGRPIITTDAAGCRETVVDRVTGFLVPVKAIKALTEKMIWFIEHPEEIEKMGQNSLKLCREKYDVKKVNEIMLTTMGLIR